jgi:hypothetical protein
VISSLFTLFLVPEVGLAIVLDYCFDNTAYTVGKNKKCICTRYETGKKNSPKDCISMFFKINKYPGIKFITFTFPGFNLFASVMLDSL